MSKDGVVFPEECEEQFPCAWDRQQLAVVAATDGSEGADRCVVHELCVLVGKHVWYAMDLEGPVELQQLNQCLDARRRNLVRTRLAGADVQAACTRDAGMCPVGDAF